MILILSSVNCLLDTGMDGDDGWRRDLFIFSLNVVGFNLFIRPKQKNKKTKYRKQNIENKI